MGKVNKFIVSLILCVGGKVVGICGKDGNLLCGVVKSEELGFVGDVTQVDMWLICEFVNVGYIFVVVIVVMDVDGQVFNVNVDIVVGVIVVKFGAEKFILMTDVSGVCIDKDDFNILICELIMKEMEEVIVKGVIVGGMIFKVECCMISIMNGVKSAYIIDGRVKYSLFFEIFIDIGVGIVIIFFVVVV